MSISAPKVCGKCGKKFSGKSFLPAKSHFLPDDLSPFCRRCCANTIKSFSTEWKGADRLCQLLNYPFIPTVWEKYKEENDLEGKLNAYFSFFSEDEEFSSLDWTAYYNAFIKLKEEGSLDDEIPLLSEKKKREIINRWGADSELTEADYYYLQTLYEGILSGQPMTNALIEDNIRKICHTLLLIDRKIRAGEEYDKLMRSYDSLMKMSGLSVHESKQSGEIESIGELAAYLEKKDWLSKRHEEDRDVVDLTLKEIQINNQRLYTNEPGIGEEINARVENLKASIRLERAAEEGEEDSVLNKGKLVPSYQEAEEEPDPYLLDGDEDEDFEAEIKEEEENGRSGIKFDL